MNKTNTKPILVRNLRKGMVVVSLDTGKTRTCTTDALACRARGYFRADTTGEPVNTHGANTVHVLAQEGDK